MKKINFIVLLMMLLVFCSSFVKTVMAAQEESTFLFDLSVDGKDTVEVQPGDIITVTLHLNRTNSSDAFTMYSMQDEIRYNDAFFEYMEGCEVLGSGVVINNISKADRYKEVYMNYLSMSGGSQWNANTFIGSMQLKVLEGSGIELITNEDFLVSTKDGTNSYSCEANDLKIVFSTDCTVRFETNGGTAIDDQIVIYGEKIKRPEDPVREGYQLEGWYTDIDRTDEWDFDKDVVQSNMVLYAKWTEKREINYIPCLVVLFLILLLLLHYILKRNRYAKRG